MTSAQATVPALAWMRSGTEQLQELVDGLPDEALGAGTPLPGWTRRHLLAHVASNAEALQRLTSWAATGVESRMYSSSEQRADDIESGSRREADELRTWVRDSAQDLASDLAGLDEHAWQASVVTAQGRTVPATEVPWMRAREVMVHAVDLDAGRTFADLPRDFLVALLDDVTGKRSKAPGGPALTLHADETDHQWSVSGSGDALTVTAPLADLAAWLTGRPHRLDPAGLPELPAWL